MINSLWSIVLINIFDFYVSYFSSSRLLFNYFCNYVLDMETLSGKGESKCWWQRDMNIIHFVFVRGVEMMKDNWCYLSFSLSFFLSPYFPPRKACQVILYLSTIFILCSSALIKGFQIKSETRRKYEYHANMEGPNWFDTEIYFMIDNEINLVFKILAELARFLSIQNLAYLIWYHGWWYSSI